MELIRKGYTAHMVLLATLMVSTFGFSQTGDNSDLQSWNTLGLEYEPNKKWSFGLEQQLRLDENISEISEYFTQLETKYAITKKFDIGLGLRYIRENDNEGNVQGYENHFRFNVDASYKHKINNLELKYRLRYQNKNELGIGTSEGDYAKQYLRLKAAVEYDFDNWKLDPNFSAEIFNRFENEDADQYNKYRLTFGTDYKIKNFGKLGLYYRFEESINVDIPETTHIIGFNYTYTIKNKKK
ncbi:DUF2490 domain-containing protein [uncultured Maribacter sp.]|uniref:DUF2490 domain-containing protein n=1 Tax=uncultured Maribacter sp. TaxID=431308 RepID=UPI0030EF2011|tara:strand:- start:447 stop:1169 length:723 start_codon:yes stop_codon:yes gene_type:complete